MYIYSNDYLTLHQSSHILNRRSITFDLYLSQIKTNCLTHMSVIHHIIKKLTSFVLGAKSNDMSMPEGPAPISNILLPLNSLGVR